MIYTTQEIKNFIERSVGGKDILFKKLNATGNMTARLEDGGNDTLLLVEVDGKEYVLKMKSKAFDHNVCGAMNWHDTDEFRRSFEKGKSIFYIRGSYDREGKIYKAFSSLKENLPIIYGSESDDTRSIILMEKLPISRITKDEEIARLLKKWHAQYPLKEDAERLGANVHTQNDYENATDLSLKLFELIEECYPNFPAKIIKTGREYVQNYAKNYLKGRSFPSTLCHGDLTINNLTTDGEIILYDLELATYSNPEFDLISYLVHYPTQLTNEIVERFLRAYYDGKINEDALKHNLLTYLCTRFHAMMMITKKLHMPYMEQSIKNYIFLFDYFKV